MGLSYDSVDKLKQFARSQKVEFPLLSDQGSVVIKKLDLLADEKKGLPHPGTLIIDTDGVVAAKLFHEGYRTRNTNEEIIAAAEALAVEAGE